MNIKEIYENLYNSQLVLNQYQKIEEYEKVNKGWAYHNLEHIKNVIAIVEQILIKLNFDEEFIYKAKIACLLHDIGADEGKDNHAYKSFIYVEDYFVKNNIEFEDLDLVLDAIKTHSDGFDTNNIIALSLILADKLDIKKTRISEEGRNIIGNRQYLHIEDIFIDISNNILTINFLTDGNIDFKEINEYYFTKKVFNAIEKFSNKIGLKYLVYLDNKEWII